MVVAIFALSWLPSVESDAVTTFSDQGTGAAGHAAAGRTYDLYAGMDGILQYPVPGNVVPQILSLQFGPWQFNIMGLYVVLLLASPLILAALKRGKACAGPPAGTTPLRPGLGHPAAAAAVPVRGLLSAAGVAGAFRRRHGGRLPPPRDRRLVRPAPDRGRGLHLLAALLALFSWCNPYLANAYDVRLALLPDALYQDVYDRYFNRTFLGPGRLLNVLVIVVAGYALLSAYWALLKRALGWLLIPLGQATLYVFILHVLLMLSSQTSGAAAGRHPGINTAAYAVVLGAPVADGPDARPVRDHPHLSRAM